MKNVFLKFIIEGTDVEAKATYLYPNEFLLELTNPQFDSFFTSPHIMYAVLGARRFFDNNDIITDYGLQHATAMATALYNGFVIVQDHYDKINVKADEIIEEIFNITVEEDKEINKQNAIRRKWKAKFINGQIFEKEYVRELKIIESFKIDLKNEYLEKKRNITTQALLSLEPDVITIEEKCCGGYTVPLAVRRFFFRQIDKKIDKLLNNNKLTSKSKNQG